MHIALLKTHDSYVLFGIQEGKTAYVGFHALSIFLSSVYVHPKLNMSKIITFANVLNMKPIRKIVAFTLMLQIWLSSVGYAMSRVECMVTGDAVVQINDLTKPCLNEIHPSKHGCCEKHKGGESAKKLRKKCCNQQAQTCSKPKVQSERGTSDKEQVKDNCCNSIVADIHLDEGANAPNETLPFNVLLPIILVFNGFNLFEAGDDYLVDEIHAPPLIFQSVSERLALKSVWLI